MTTSRKKRPLETGTFAVYSPTLGSRHLFIRTLLYVHINKYKVFHVEHFVRTMTETTDGEIRNSPTPEPWFILTPCRRPSPRRFTWKPLAAR